MFLLDVNYADLEAMMYLIVLVLLILSTISQFVVYGAYRRYDKVIVDIGYTPAEIAQQMLRENGVFDVQFTRARFQLGDHYNPRQNTIALSGDQTPSVAAIAVACHEAGHAVQHHQRYALMRLRTALLPLTIVANYLVFIVIILGIIVFFLSESLVLLIVGACLLGVLTLFALVTLPIELDASRRAMRFLANGMLRERSEIKGARKVLRSAAYTYLFAFLVSLAQTMRVVLMIMSLMNNRRR